MNHNICKSRRGINGILIKSNMHNGCVYERESENGKTRKRGCGLVSATLLLLLGAHHCTY